MYEHLQLNFITPHMLLEEMRRKRKRHFVDCTGKVHSALKLGVMHSDALKSLGKNLFGNVSSWPAAGNK